MSSLSWIDFDETDRQRARRIIALFDEKETRDELGLGPIRDSIADHLFPGTSTIQTRLRYMLFIPWIYTMVEEIDAKPNRLMEEARNREIRLINALRSSGETEGVIGRVAGSGLKRLPSSVYWNGLQNWGIRLFPGSQEAYFASLPSLRRHLYRSSSAADSSVTEHSNNTLWTTALPAPPQDFLERADFQLTIDEAGFLIDRLVDSHPESLLTHLAKTPHSVDCDFVWAHPDFSTFTPAIVRLVKHAENFSAVMRGASLLYNLMLAECREKQEWIDDYKSELADWRTHEFNQVAISQWSLPEFWERTEHDNHRIHSRTKVFVRHWCELASENDGQVAGLEAARDLVREREKSLKRSQSRFINQAVLARWGGRSGADRLNFRWREASSHIRDLANAS